MNVPSAACPDQQQLILKKAGDDLASLRRVSHRLALTEDDKLPSVLDKLLPRLLKRVGENHQLQVSLRLQQEHCNDRLSSLVESIQRCLVEMFSHVLKRVKADASLPLPCADMASQLLDALDSSASSSLKHEREVSRTEAQPESTDAGASFCRVNQSPDSLFVNLTLTFLTVGIPRLERRAAVILTPLLLRGWIPLARTGTEQQVTQWVHLLLACWERGASDAVEAGANGVVTTNKPNAPGGAEGKDPTVVDVWSASRTLVRENDVLSALTYDLLLDALLYEPPPPQAITASPPPAVNSNRTGGLLPPDGLSQSGFSRLVNGPSMASSPGFADWGAEMAQSSVRRAQMKQRLLDLLAPSRSHRMLLDPSVPPKMEVKCEDENEGHDPQQRDLGLARTLSLLLVATGDSQSHVQERAGSYWKIYRESQQQRSASAAPGTTAESNAGGPESFASVVPPLCVELLSLCLGQAQAEASLASLSTRSIAPIGALPLSPAPVHDIQRSTVAVAVRPASIVWASKRRPVSESHAMGLLKFVVRALEEHPNAWIGSDDGGTAEEEMDGRAGDALLAVATLGVRVAQLKLGTVSVSGLTVQRARPQIVSARLLRAIATRLTVRLGRRGTCLDTFSLSSTATATTTTTILAQSLALACSVLKAVAQRRTSPPPAAVFGNEGNVELRDTCYGVVCTLSRSRAFGARFASPLFVCGEAEDGLVPVAASVRMVELLFGCTCYEEERLRPRAVAALDALLGAYRQVWVDTKPDDVSLTSVCNPWSNANGAVSTAASIVSSNGHTVQASDRYSLGRSLLPLLWTAGQAYQTKASRVAAAHWASDLLKYLDPPGACHLLCFLAGDADFTAASVAVNGLGIASAAPSSSLSWILSQLRSDRAAGESRFPSFSAISRAIFVSSAIETKRRASNIQRYWDFSFRGKAAALKFGIACLLSDLYDNEIKSTEEYLSALCETLRLFMQQHSGPPGFAQGRWSVELLDDAAACLHALLAASSFSRAKILGGDSGLTLKDIEELTLTVISSNARRELSRVSGLLYEAFDYWDSQKMAERMNFTTWVAESGVETTISTAVTGLHAMESHGSTSKTVHGCAYLGASAARAFRFASLRYRSYSSSEQEATWQNVCSILQLLGRGTKALDEAIANACTDGLEIILSFDGIDAPPLDVRLYEACATTLYELADAMTLFGNGESAEALRTSRLARATGTILAATGNASGDVESNGNVKLNLSRAACVSSLFNLLGSASFRKDEVGLVIGEALATYADTNNARNHASISTSADWPSEYVEDFATRLPPHQQVAYVLQAKVAKSSSPHVRNACAPALLALVARVVSGIHKDSTYSRRALSVELRKRLETVQLSFLQLLAYTKIKHLPRECCCLGLAACRGIAGTIDSVNELGDSATDVFNKRLLRAFGQSNKFSTSAYMETVAQAAARREAERRAAVEDNFTTTPISTEDDDNVGGTAGMSEASLGAYREIAAASVALGRHDIFYWLLVMSVTHPCWSDEERRTCYSPRCLLGDSASFGNGSDLEYLQRALRPHLGGLIPRILRAKYDPNKQTRDQMAALWIGLTGGGAASREIVSDHLLSTINILVKDSTSKLWRSRVGACGALAEILVGRTWDDLGGGDAILTDDAGKEDGKASAGVLVIQLWSVTMRAVDDVHGAVREVGLTLGRGVRSLTIQLCNPNAMDLPSGAKRERDEVRRKERNVRAASATALRWLIRHGLGQQCAVAAGLCISTLVEVVSTAHPAMLGPILPDLLRSLLMAISGLEPAALNFLQLRTDDQDGLVRLRLQLAQSGPIAMAVTKCLDVIPMTDIETQHATVSQLEAALRSSAGFATRAAVADSVTALCSSCPSAFRFASASSGNPSVRLLRGLYFASERERTSAAKDKMIHALGNLAGLCPGSSVRALAAKACERYIYCTGNNEDITLRKAAASAIRAIIVRSDQLADGGKFDIWRTRVLPVAFLGRKDDDEKISRLWQEVWNEAGAARQQDESAQRSFGSRMEEKLLPYLVSESLRAVQDVSWSRRRSGVLALRELGNIGVLAPATLSTSTSLSSGDMQRARYRSEASRSSLRGCVRVVSQPRLWTGKSIAVKAAVELAWKWIGPECSVGGADARVLYGFDKPNSTNCSWKPISINLSEETENDLFLGDGWFSHTDSDIFLDSMGDIPVAMDVTERSNDLSTGSVGADDGNDSDSHPEYNTRDNTEHCESFPLDSSKENSPLLFSGFARLLLVQATQTSSTSVSEEALPYKVAALQGLQTLMASLPSCPVSNHAKHVLFNRFKGELFSAVSGRHVDTPPVITAGLLGVLGSLVWQGMGHNHASVLDEMMTILSPMVLNHAWTVREASSLCFASLSSSCTSSWLRQQKVVSALIHHAQESFRDPKFWRVRLAGIKILESIAARAGSRISSDEEAQLILDSFLPHKDVILHVLNSSLKDSEPQVSAAGSQVLIRIAWWP